MDLELDYKTYSKEIEEFRDLFLGKFPETIEEIVEKYNDFDWDLAADIFLPDEERLKYESLRKPYLDIWTKSFKPIMDNYATRLDTWVKVYKNTPHIDGFFDREHDQLEEELKPIDEEYSFQVAKIFAELYIKQIKESSL